MKKIFSLLCKLSAILIAFLLIILLITPVFIPKFTGEFPTTSVIDGFYALPEHHIDVLFLGSSQIMTSVSPMRIYEQYGYTGYNLGTEQQNMIASYYLLKEALKYQDPQIVVLDIMFLFPYTPESLLNSKEEFVRKSIDCMKWSENKLEFVKTVCDLDSAHEFRNYLFPFIRYHSRWSDLSLSDVSYLFQDKNNPLRGFSIAGCVEDSEDLFEGFTPKDKDAKEDLLPVMEEYFYKIVNLCKERNISLVLIKTPKADGSFSEAKHNSIQQIADEEQLSFIDFNEKSVYDAADFHAETDYNDSTHINYYGAYKISDYLADYLFNNYSLTDHRADTDYDYWNKDLEIYTQKTSFPIWSVFHL